MRQIPSRGTPSLLQTIRTAFEEIDRVDLPKWLCEALATLRVRNTTAVFFYCEPAWEIIQRRIGDDMLFYVISGKGTATVGNRRYPLAAGSCMSFQRGIPHAVTHDARAPLSVISIHYTAKLYDSLDFPEVFGFPAAFDFSNDKQIEGMVHEACREYSLRPPGWGSGVSALVLRLLLHIIWHYSRELQPTQVGSRADDLQRLSPAIALMKNALAQSPSISDYARAVGLSEPQFRRVFRRAFGEPPARYIQRTRVELACHLLRTTNMTIEAISGELGYAEPAFFANIFRRHVGTSPGRFRKGGML